MFVVVLGQQLSSAGIHPQLRRRVDAGLEAVASTDASHLVCSGGRTNETIPRTESEVMKSYAIEQGISPERILTEERSQDTIGNAYFTRRLLEDRVDAPTSTPETIFLVTSTYHEARSAYIFERCFGDEYCIDTSFTVDTPARDERRNERRSFEQARAFFDPIESGDLPAIRRRLVDIHDYYKSGETVEA